MNETFDLPVIFEGKELSFKSTLIILGYTYRIEVDVFGTGVIFEPDEERNFRAMIDLEKLERGIIDVELLKAIVEAIERARAPTHNF